MASSSRSEGDRLAALRRYELLDTASEPGFEQIVGLASSTFDVPIALVSLMDADRQWFKARCGIGAGETRREVAFCRFTILQDEVMVVPDASADARFADNPLVTGEPGIRFYAGAPLHTSDGFNIGTVCLIDTKPRHRFDRADRQRLANLAGITMELIEARLRGLHAEQHATTAAAEHQRLLDAIEAVPAAFSLFDRDDRLLLFNSRYKEIFWQGMENQVALGLTFEELLRRRARGGAIAINGRTENWVERRLDYRRRGEGSLELRLPDGCWTRAFERRTADGGVIAVNVDITELKERERALESASSVLRSTLDSIAQGVCAFDANLRLVAWNDRFIELLGFPAEFAQAGRSLADFIRYMAQRGEYGTGDPEELTAARLAQVQAPEPYEFEWLRPNGQALEVRGNPTRGGGFVRSYQDITRRKQREEQLGRALALQYAILNSTTATIVAAELDGTISTFNPAAERLLGFARDEMVGRAPIVALHDPDELEQRAVRMGQRLGRPVQSGLEVLVGELSGGQASEGEWTYVRADGGRVPMFLSIDGLRSQAGDLIGFLAVGTDISELKKIERMKSEFVSTVSHELRTPLTSIKGSLSLLLGGLAGSLPDRARQMVEIAASNTDRLVRLINDILDIEKIESGRMSFRRDALKLGVLLAEAIEQNEAYADQYGVRLELAPLTLPVEVEGDRDRLLQVMANLLSNAIKFSPRGETVRVEVAVRDGRVHIAVVDRGPGIPLEFHAQIFQKFAQADASDSRQRGGTGLGLSICKAILERLDGSIGFESEPGEGSTFYVELPLVPVPGERRSGTAGRMLVCEDDPASGRLLETILRSEGFEVDVASDLGAVRERLAATSYDAMTLDLVLPDGNGLDLVRELKGAATAREIPVIVVSISARGEPDPETGDVVGIADWIQKPVGRARLVEAVRTAMASRAPSRFPRVLYVEDDATLRHIVDAALRDDMDIDQAADLQEAKSCLARNRYDLLLLDIGLPDGSGLELLHDLSEAGQSSPPVVIFSAEDASDEVGRIAATQLTKARTAVEEVRTAILIALNRNDALNRSDERS